MTVTTYKWTIEKWHELVNSGVLDGQKVELLEQNIVHKSPEGIEHSYTTENVVIYLRNLLSNLAHVKESHPITLDNSEPEPDIAIVRLPETIYRNHHPYAEDIYWLIEISQRTLKKDLEQKSFTYARNSIPEYWVIDLQNKQVIVHTQPRDNIAIDRLVRTHKLYFKGTGNREQGTEKCPNSFGDCYKYLQVVTYQSGVISPLAFPEIEIALQKLLLF